MSRSTTRWAVLLVLAGLVAVRDAAAADRSWTSPLGGEFHEPTNWSGDMVPASGDLARFPLQDTYTVTFDADAETYQLEVGSGVVTFDLGGFTYRATSTSRNYRALVLGVNPDVVTELTLRHGALQAGRASVGTSLGPAILRVLAGATLVTGYGDLYRSGFAVGDNFSGTLLVTGGGAVSGSSLSVLPKELSADSMVLADGSGSTLNMQEILLNREKVFGGGQAEGSLRVTNGGSVTVGNCLIGGFSGPGRGLVVLEGPGSTLVATDDILMGMQGPGSSEFAVIGGLPQIQVGGDFQMGNSAATLSATIDDTGLSTITVAGSAELWGTFEVALAPGFTPLPAERFVVLSAGAGISGGLTLGGPDATDFDLAIDAGQLILTCYAPELTWGGAGPGNWGDGPWTGGAPGALPDERTRTVVNDHTVTVGADRSAFSLTVGSGAVAIAPAGTLTVADDVSVRPGAALEILGTLRVTDPIVTNDVNVDTGAMLSVAGTLQSDTLTTAGTNTFSAGAALQLQSLTFDSSATTVTGVTIHAARQFSANSPVTLYRGATLTAGTMNVNAPITLCSGAVVTAGTINVNRGATLTADTGLGSVANLRLDGGEVTCTAVLNSPVVEVFSGKLTTAGANVTDLYVEDGELSTSADVTATDIMNFVGGRLTTSGITTVSAASMDMTETTDINVTSGHLTVDLPTVGGIIGQRSIGVNFRSQWAEAELSPSDSAGVFAQMNWNNTDGSSTGENSNTISPAAGSPVDNSGTVVDGLTVAWSANTTWRTGNSGTGDHKLMDGYLDDTDSSGVTEVAVTGVPYAQYAVYAYVGSDGDDRKG
jgi:hypothetical protein